MKNKPTDLTDIGGDINKQTEAIVKSSLANCRSAMQNIAALSSSICDIFDKAELYESKQLAEEQLKNCYRILRSTKNIDDLYLYADNTFFAQVFKLSDILLPICKSVERLTAPTNKKFELDFTDLEIKLNADIKRFENAFLNLLSNAFCYSGDEAQVKVSVKNIGDNIIIRVSDDGYGMSSGTLSNAAKPGFTTETDKFKQGLGLYLANQFAEKSNGKLMIASKENEGTSVSLILPITNDDAMPLENKETVYNARLFSPVDIALCETFDIRLINLL